LAESRSRRIFAAAQLAKLAATGVKRRSLYVFRKFPLVAPIAGSDGTLWLVVAAARFSDASAPIHQP